jgi:hypothetical protein
MKIRTIVLSAVLFATSAPAVYAGSKIMATGPGGRNYPNPQQLDCNILNANKTAKPVTIEVMDYSGIVTDSSGPLVLAPSTGASITATDPFASWCRFTVDGSPKKYRAGAAYSNATEGYTTYTPAQ